MKKTVALSLDEEVIEDLDQAAEMFGMSRSALVNMLLKGVVGKDMSDLTSVVATLVGNAMKANTGASGETEGAGAGESPALA